MNPFIAFGIGILWELILGIQMRLMARGTKYLSLFFTTLLASLFWGYMIRALVFGIEVIPYYAVGTGIGICIGLFIAKGYESRNASPSGR